MDPEASKRLEHDMDDKSPCWFPSWSWALLIGEVDVVNQPIPNLFYVSGGHDGRDVVASTSKAKVAGGMPELAEDEAIIALQ